MYKTKDKEGKKKRRREEAGGAGEVLIHRGYSGASRQQCSVTTQGWEPLIYRQSGCGPGKRTPWKSSDQPTRGHVTVETHTGVSTHDA